MNQIGSSAHPHAYTKRSGRQQVLQIRFTHGGRVQCKDTPLMHVRLEGHAGCDLILSAGARNTSAKGWERGAGGATLLRWRALTRDFVAWMR